VRVRMHIYNPEEQGYKDLVVHSIYIYESDDDLIEFGWFQDENYFVEPSDVAVVLRLKVFAGDTIEGGITAPFYDVGDDRTAKILRNPNGGAPSRFEFKIGNDDWGFFTQANMQSGGAVVAGVENFDSCEDLRMHAWDMDHQLIPGGTWSNWGTLMAPGAYQVHDMWWWNQSASPPEWWVKHCGSPWCPDDM
jgi:hypothetical protein